MRRLFATLVMCSALAPAHGAVQVHVMLSGGDAPYRAAAAALAQGLGVVPVSTGLAAEPVPPEATILVPLGMLAAEHAIRSAAGRPVFATLVPAASWERLSARAEAVNATALYLDQPLERHAALVRALLPPVRELGVVFGPSSGALTARLHEVAARLSIRVHGAVVADPEDVGDAVVTVLQRSEALLALPDPQAYNRYTVRAVLLATFRLRRPVIGFSEAWVRAGALGAVHSTPEQLGGELAGIISAWTSERGPVPEARYPSRYSLSVNRQVAFSLGLHLPADPVLIERVGALEVDR